MELISFYACKKGVVSIAEIGFDEMTRLEEKYFRLQLELAKKLDMLVNGMVHTLHRHKKEGTCRSMDICEQDGLNPARAMIDHNNEETVEETLTRGV